MTTFFRDWRGVSVRQVVAIGLGVPLGLLAGCSSTSGVATVAIPDPMAHHVKQESPTLCWAACVQMVDSIEGRDSEKTQQELRDAHHWPPSRFFPASSTSATVFQMTVDRFPSAIGASRVSDAAAMWEIEDALSPGYIDWQTRERQVFVLDPLDFIGPRMSTQQVIDTLARGEGIIVSLTVGDTETQRHAYVLVAADYQPAAWFLDDPDFVKVGLLDPFFGEDESPTMTWIDGAEFEKRKRAVISRNWVKQKQLEEREWIERKQLQPGYTVRLDILRGWVERTLSAIGLAGPSHKTVEVNDPAADVSASLSAH